KNELMIVVRPRLADPMPPGVDIAVPDRGPLRREDVRTQATDAPVTRPLRPSKPLPAEEPAPTGDMRATPDAPSQPGVRARPHAGRVRAAAVGDEEAADA